MTILQSFLLSLIQGISEFLPISSSAHLILLPALLNWQDQGVTFDVVIHVGTLTAVIAYFRRDIWQITIAFCCQWQKNGGANHDAKLGNMIIIATIPAAVVGLLLHDYITTLRHPLIIAFSTFFFGLLLGYGDFYGKKEHPLTKLNYGSAFLIGLAQTLALVPGTSRSGITMTAALMLGLQRDAAARFSFLMAIPIILAAGALETVKLLKTPENIQLLPLAVGFCTSAISAYICIALFIKLISKTSMLPYVIYRVLLAIFLVIIFI